MKARKQQAYHGCIVCVCVCSAPVSYLRVTTLVCQNFHCSRQPNPVNSLASNAVVTYGVYLSADGSTICYQGAHIASTVFSVLLILGFTLGLPCYCFVMLMRAFSTPQTSGINGWLRRHFSILRDERAEHRRAIIHQAAVTFVSSGTSANAPASPSQAMSAPVERAVTRAADVTLERDRADSYGFLYLKMKPGSMLVVTLLFSQALYAVVTVFCENQLRLGLFFYGLVAFCSTPHMALSQPFVSAWQNMQKVLVGCLSIAHSAIMLAVQDTDRLASDTAAYVGTLLGLLGLLVIVLLLRHNTARRRVKPRTADAVSAGVSPAIRSSHMSPSGTLRGNKTLHESPAVGASSLAIKVTSAQSHVITAMVPGEAGGSDTGGRYAQ
jgi:hypothetical protein